MAASFVIANAVVAEVAAMVVAVSESMDLID
jgi:hypothetical protein